MGLNERKHRWSKNGSGLRSFVYLRLIFFIIIISQAGVRGKLGRFLGEFQVWILIFYEA